MRTRRLPMTGPWVSSPSMGSPHLTRDRLLTLGPHAGRVHAAAVMTCDGDRVGTDDVRHGVSLTNLDQPLFDGAQATKRDLVDYLDAAADRILPGLRGRPLSVIRVLRGQQPFMQKNLPKYAPPWLGRVRVWAASSHREVEYGLCEDRQSLLWFANQRAVEYHPTLMRAESWDQPTHLVLDIDPPEGSAFPVAVAAARLVSHALAEVGMAGSVKTRGAQRRAGFRAV